MWLPGRPLGAAGPGTGSYRRCGGDPRSRIPSRPPSGCRRGRTPGYDFPLLCDPDLGAYKAYGLPEGVPATITEDFPWRPDDTETSEKWTASRGGTERAQVDHPWQLPGEFVIAGGRIVLAHRAQSCADFPLTEVLLGAIAAARA